MQHWTPFVQRLACRLPGAIQAVMWSMAHTNSMPAGVEQQWAPQRILTAALHRVSHFNWVGL